MYFSGTLAEGVDGRDAVASPQNPRAFCVGFESSSDTGEPIIRRSDGALLYVDKVNFEIRQFVPDSLRWNSLLKSWEYPDDPAANDLTVLKANCKTAPIGLRTIPEDGTPVYACDGRFVSGEGTPFGPPKMTLLEIGPGRRLLARETETHPYDLVLIDSDLSEAVVSGGPGVTQTQIARATDGGFWLVSQQIDGPAERWFISYTGEATLQGAYCAEVDIQGTVVPAPALLPWQHRIDDDGYLWQHAVCPDPVESSDVIIRRTLQPSVCEVVYDSRNVPQDDTEDWAAAKPNLAVRWFISTFLTGG